MSGGIKKSKAGQGDRDEREGSWSYFIYGMRGSYLRGHLIKDLKNSREEHSLCISFMWNVLFITKYYGCFSMCTFLIFSNRLLRF